MASGQQVFLMDVSFFGFLLRVLPNEQQGMKQASEQVLGVLHQVGRFDFMNPRRESADVAQVDFSSLD